MSNNVPNVKLVLLGESAVGKSSLVLQYCNQTFKEHCEATIGAAFMTKMEQVGDRVIKYEIWDTAGQERYRSLAPMYYRGTQAAIVVYDTTNEASLDNAKTWIAELNRTLTSDHQPVIALVGNKCDLVEGRRVSKEEGQAFAEANDAIFIETSAKDNVNVDKLFMEIAKKLLSRDFISKQAPNGVNLGSNAGESNGLFSGCCK